MTLRLHPPPSMGAVMGDALERALGVSLPPLPRADPQQPTRDAALESSRDCAANVEQLRARLATEHLEPDARRLLDRLARTFESQSRKYGRVAMQHGASLADVYQARDDGIAIARRERAAA